MQHLSRRELILSATAAVAFTRNGAIAQPAVRREPAARPPHRAPQKAVKYGMIAAGKTVQEKFALLRDCGFDGVELDSPSDLRREDVLAAMQATGLVVPGVVDSVHWQQPFSAPDEAVRKQGREALATALRDAKAYGGTSVLVVPAVVNKQVAYLSAWRRSQAEIKQLLPLAQELQIEILIENVWNGFLLGPTELARYVDEFESPLVGVHFDPGNLVRFGHPEQWVEILGKRIKKVDVKEFDRKKHSFDVKLNEGDTDWPAVMRELRAIGYDGWFTAEMAGGDSAYLRDLGQRMDAFLRA